MYTLTDDDVKQMLTDMREFLEEWDIIRIRVVMQNRLKQLTEETSDGR